MPIVPILSGRVRGMLVPAGEVSVMPQPPSISWPVARFSLRAISTGSEAPPDAQ